MNNYLELKCQHEWATDRSTASASADVKTSIMLQMQWKPPVKEEGPA